MSEVESVNASDAPGDEDYFRAPPGVFMNSTVTGETNKSPYQKCLDWIYYQKSLIEQARYGRNRRSVQDAIAEQEAKAKVIQDFRRDVDRAKLRSSTEESKNLDDQYEALQEASRKKLQCLNTMLEITSLEEHCGNLSNEFDHRAVHLVNPEDRNKTGDHLQGFVSPSAQDCIFAAKDNWNWIVKMVQCTDTHLKNAATYHQFFHDVDETTIWLLDDLERLSKSLEMAQLKGDYSDAKQILKELEEMTTALRQWEAKANFFWETANRVVPVPLRIHGITEATPCRSLADYETKEISVREGEDLLLLDNTKSHMWRVRNSRGQEAEVPSLIVLIPGPAKDAIDAAAKMRLQLLAAWTNTVKRVGKRLLCFMLLVFKPDYSEDEINSLKSVRDLDKTELTRILDLIEDTLRNNWSDHEAFINLQERILALRMILEEAGENPFEDENVARALVVQIKMLEELMDKYKDLFKDWEGYRITTEAARQPEMMLMVDKWEQLKYVDKDTMTKHWQQQLPFTEIEKSLAGLKELAVEGANFGEDESFDEGMMSTDSITTHSGSETITSRSYGTSGLSSPIGGSSDSGMSETVVRTSTTRGFHQPGESYSRIGMETVSPIGGSSGEGMTETIVQTRTSQVSAARPVGSDGSGGYGYSTSVRSTRGGGMNGAVQHAMASSGLTSGYETLQEGVMESSSGFGFEDMTTRGRVTSTDSTDFGYATETKTAETEQLVSSEMEENKRFIIRSVVDPRDDSTISLQQAIMLGIIQPDSGRYVNPANGEEMPIPNAMTAGLIKVEFTSTRRGQEKKSSIGIINVKTIREQPRPYIIMNVKDTSSGQSVSQAEGTKRGIINEENGIYRDKRTGQEMLIVEAIQQDLVKVEYTGDTPDPEVISKTYAVRAVVDRRLKKVITFQEAVRRGIIKRESGAYHDTMTGQDMYVGDAIMRGFLKARIITDTSTLNINPENRMVIDKTETIRKKLLRPLGVISAFRAAAAKKN